MRFAFDMLVLFITFLCPWWLAVGLALLLIIFFKSYEVILCGLILDSMYANGNTFSKFGEYLYTATMLFSISISWLVAPYIRGIEKK